MSVRRSTREIGLAFEKHAQRFLNGSLHMSVKRVGGAGDGGVDLRGWWWLPKPFTSSTSISSTSNSASSTSMRSPRLPKATSKRGLRRLRVLGQCKAERARLGPRAVRELEGVMAHLRVGEVSLSKSKREKIDTIAILLSQSGFSQAAMIHATRSIAPFLLVHLPGGRPYDLSSPPSIPIAPFSPLSSSTNNNDKDDDVDDDILVEAWWNPSLTRILADVELRREILRGSGSSPLGHEDVRARLGVWWYGHRLGRLGPELDEDVD